MRSERALEQTLQMIPQDRESWHKLLSQELAHGPAATPAFTYSLSGNEFTAANPSAPPSDAADDAGPYSLTFTDPQSARDFAMMVRRLLSTAGIMDPRIRGLE